MAGAERPTAFRPQSCAGTSRTERLKSEQPSLVELLQDLSLSGREELFFMQLPDCMPGRASGAKVDLAETPAAKEGKHEVKRTPHLQAKVSRRDKHIKD